MSSLLSRAGAVSPGTHTHTVTHSCSPFSPSLLSLPTHHDTLILSLALSLSIKHKTATYLCQKRPTKETYSVIRYQVPPTSRSLSSFSFLIPSR